MPDADNGDCDCGELLIRGKRVPPPKYHDCTYVAQRNSLIPQAEAVADSKVATVNKASEDDGVALTKDLRYGVGVGVVARVLCAADTVCLTAELPRT